jgi:hypothetical protein
VGGGLQLNLKELYLELAPDSPIWSCQSGAVWIVILFCAASMDRASGHLDLQISFLYHKYVK